MMISPDRRLSVEFMNSSLLRLVELKRQLKTYSTIVILLYCCLSIVFFADCLIIIIIVSFDIALHIDMLKGALHSSSKNRC